MREEVALGFSTGDKAIDAALVDLIGRLALRLEECDIGFYLHGSAFAGVTRPTSDIDVLGLGNDLVTRSENQTAKAVAAEVSSRTGLDLDVKVFSATAFAEDPWVNLWEGAAILSGRDWRTELPKPSTDSLAREAVLHACLIIGDGSAGEAEHFVPHPKDTAWLVSALLAVRHGYVAPGRSTAAEALKRYEPQWAAAIEPGFVVNDSAVITQLHDEVRTALQTDVHSEDPVLGTRCHAVVSEYLNM